MNVFDIQLKPKAQDFLERISEKGLGFVLVTPEELIHNQSKDIQYEEMNIPAGFGRFCDIATTDILPTSPFATIGKHERTKHLLQKFLNLVGARNINISPLVEYNIEEIRRSWAYKADEFMAFNFEGLGPGKEPRITRADIMSLGRYIDPRIIELVEDVVVNRRGENYGYRVIQTVMEYLLLATTGFPLLANLSVIGLGGTVYFDSVVTGEEKVAQTDVAKYLREALNYFVRTYGDEAELLGLSDFKVQVENYISKIADAESVYPPLVEIIPAAIAVIKVLSSQDDKNLMMAAIAYAVATQLLFVGALKIEGLKLPRQITHLAASLSKYWSGILALPENTTPKIVVAALTLLTAHTARSLDAIEEHKDGTANRENMHKMFESFKLTLGSEYLWLEHAMNILLKEELEERLENGRRRFTRLDEVQPSSQERGIQRPYILFDDFNIGIDGRYFVEGGKMLLEAGSVNIIEIPSREERMICLAQLGEFFKHERGTTLLREQYEDINIHEKSELQAISYHRCDYDRFFYDPFTLVSNEDLMNYFRANNIRTDDISFEPTDHYFLRKRKLIRKYLLNTEMFDENEIDSTKLGDSTDAVVSASYARRVKVAAAMLSRSRTIVLKGVYELDEVQKSQLTRETEMLDKISTFLSREARKGEKIILLGTDGKNKDFQEKLKRENALGRIYTIENKQFVEVTN